jgi:plastocyanin
MIRVAMIAFACLFAGAAAAQTVISQKDKEFKPEAATVKAGQSLRFNNDDNVAHNVTVKGPDGVSKNIGLQKVGDHTDVAFDKAGDHEVRCAIHPKMKMTVKVQ